MSQLTFRKLVSPILAFIVALTVLAFAVAWVAIGNATNATSEHVDHGQIMKIETYLNQQIAKSKGCSSEPSNPALKSKCEQTVDGFIDSLDKNERRALAVAIQPYLLKGS